MKHKRIIAILLCVALLIPMLPTVFAPEVAAADIVDEYGTKLTVPEDFNADDGVHPYGSGDAADTTSNLMPVKEVGVYVSAKSNYSSKVYNFTEDTILNGDNGSNSGIFGSQYDYMETENYFGGSNAPLSTQGTNGDIGELRFAAGVAYDPKGTGRDDHVAYVGATRGEDPQWALYTADASSNGSFHQAWRDTWNAGLNGTGRKAYEWVKTTTRYDSSGYASIAAGDFDGDGRDTLVFYDPALSLLDLQEYDENANGGTAKHIYMNGGTLGRCQALSDLFGQSLDYITQFSSFAGGSDSCLNIPMLQMDSGDLDNDGRDELVVTISLSNLDQENVSPNYYNGDRSSVVMLLEKNGGNWELAWAKQMSDVYVAVDGKYNDRTSSGGWYMRAASSRIVDYNKDGTKEIITVGVPSDDNADDDNFVTSGYIGVIISANGAIQTTSDTQNGSTSLVGYYFPRDTDGNDDYMGVRDSYLQCLSPTSLGVVRFDGIGTTPYIVVRGIIFQYNGSDFAAAKQGGWKDNMFQNRYIMLQPIVGNFDGNRQGREQILFVLSNGSDNDVEIGGWYYNYTTETGADESALTGAGLRSARWKVNAYGAPDVVLTAPDADTNDGMITTYEGKQYTFADPKILAILEAAPYFEDLKDDYGETLGSTSFSTATGGGSSTETSSTNSAGAYISFEQEISVMGLVNVGKVESEVAYTAEWTNSVEKESEWELELSFDAGRETNRVVLFYTPVIIYNYSVKDLSTGEETTMHINSMRKPVYSTLSVEDYNAGAALRGDPQIGEDVVSVVPGQPDSYRKDTSGLTNVVSYGQWVGTNSGSSNITQSISYSTSTTLTKEVTHSVDVKAGAGAGGFVVGGTYSHTWGSGSSTTNTESVTRSGTVADVPSDYADDYCFDWQFITWDTSVTANGKTYTVPVLSYLVQDVEQAPSVPLELNAAATANSVTLEWDAGYNSAASYQVYRYIANDNTNTHYYYAGTVNGGDYNADGTYTFTDSGLASGTLYQYAVCAVGGDGKRSPYSEIVSVVTSSATGLPVIAMQPSDQHVLPGSKATFSVTAKPYYNVDNLNFEWQSRSSEQGTWRKIENDNNSDKLVVTAEDGMNGTQYRCMVSEVPKINNTVLCVYSEPATLYVGKAASTATLSTSATSGNVAYLKPNTTSSSKWVTASYKVKFDDNTTETFGAYTNTYDSTKDSYPQIYRGTDGTYYLLTNLTNVSGPDSAGVYTASAGGKTALAAISDQVMDGNTPYSVTPVIKKVTIGSTEYEVYTATGIAVVEASDSTNTVLSISQLTLYKGPDGKYYTYLKYDDETLSTTWTEVTAYSGGSVYTENENNTFLSGTLAPVVETEDGYEEYQYNGSTTAYKKGGAYYTDTTGNTPLTALINLYQADDGNTTVQLGDIVTAQVTSSSTTYEKVSGQEVKLTANVSVADPNATVPGNVTFQIVNTSTGQSTTEMVTLNSSGTSGTATLTWTPTTAGVYTITAAYGGSPTATTATSNTVTYYALETQATTTWYDILLPASSKYGDTISASLFRYEKTDNKISDSIVTTGSYTTTAHAYLGIGHTGADGKLDVDSSGYSTTGTTLPAVLVPGDYLVKATMDDSVVATKVLTVSKRAITVSAPKIADMSVEQAKAFVLADHVGDITFSGLVNSDSYSGLFTLTGGPQAKAGRYDVKVAYVSDNSRMADFQSKYIPTFKSSTVTVTSDALCTVNYSAGANGILAAYCGGSYCKTGATLQGGSDVLFSATPDNTYKVAKWTVNGTEVSSNTTIDDVGTIILTGNDLVLKDLSGNVYVEVKFSNEVHQVTFSALGEGEIKAVQLGTTLTSPANVTGGSSVTFTATPKTNYVVKQWMIDGKQLQNSDGSPYSGKTLTLDNIAAITNIVVYFESTASYTVTYSAVDKDNTNTLAAGVTIAAKVGDSPLTSGDTAERGSTVVLTAEVTPGNAIMEWQAKTDTGDWETVAEGGNTCTIYNLQADTQIRALVNTKAATYSVSFGVVNENGDSVSDAGTLTAAYNGQNYKPKDETGMGQVSCTAYTPVSFSYVAPADYEVVEWLVNGTSVQSGLDKLDYSIASLSGDTTVKVVVRQKPKITFTQPTNGTGTITVSGTVNGTAVESLTSGAFVDYNSSIAVTLTPKTGYEVSNPGTGWTSVSNSDNYTYKIQNVQVNTIVNPSFAAIPTAVVTYSVVDKLPNSDDGLNGTLTMSVTRKGMSDYAKTYPEDGTATEISAAVYRDSVVTFTATPATGYKVSKWFVNGKEQSDRPELTISSATAQTVRVQFDPVGEEVTYGFDPAGVTDKASLSAVYQANGSNQKESFSSGNKPTANGTITFTVSDLTDGYEVEGWYVNGEKVNGETGLTYPYDVIAGTGADVQVRIIRSSYTVTFSAENGNVTANEGTIASGSKVQGDTEVTFTAFPDSATGYTFAGWTVDGTALEEATESLTLTITKDTEVKASYTLDKVRYTVTYGVIGENGTLSASAIGTDGKAAAGSNVTFTAIPAAGYRVAGWYSDTAGNTSIPGTTFEQNSYTLENLLDNASVYVAFEPIPTYDITVTVTGLGAVTATVNGKTAEITNNKLTVSHHDNVVLTAAPDALQYLKGWTLDNADQGNGSMTLTLPDVTEAHTVTANFAASQLVTFKTECGTNGTLTAEAGYGETLSTINASTGISLEKGKKVVVTAVPATGYMVAKWTVNGVEQDNLSNTLTIENLSEATTVTVEFEELKLYDIPATVEGRYTISDVKKTPLAPGDNTQIRDGGTVTFKVKPVTGRKLTALMINNVDCLLQPSEGPVTAVQNDDGSYTVTITNVTAAIEYTITAEEKTYTVSFEQPANGTLTVKKAVAGAEPSEVTTGSVLPVGTQLIITAEPNDGYVLSTLTVNGKALSGSTYTLTEDLNIVAQFKPASSGGGSIEPEETIILTPAENGTVTVSDKYAAEGDTLTITAKPDAGYELESLTATDKDGKTLTLTDNGDGTFTLTMPAEMPITITAVFAAEEPCDGIHDCPSTAFQDLDTSAWYHLDTDYVITQGLMNGTSKTTFEPESTLDRAMVVTILYRLEGEPEVGSNVFTDVEAGQWYTDAVIWAAETGVVEGYGDNLFGPEDPITREQIATILYRYAKYKGYNVTAREDISTFTDGADTSDWAKTAMSWAKAVGLVNGKENNMLDPLGNATRAEAAALFHRFCENIIK